MQPNASYDYFNQTDCWITKNSVDCDCFTVWDTEIGRVKRLMTAYAIFKRQSLCCLWASLSKYILKNFQNNFEVFRNQEENAQESCSSRGKLKGWEAKEQVPMGLRPYILFGLVFLFHMCVQYLHERFPDEIWIVRSIWNVREHIETVFLFYFLR